jgi:hypothetical protein
MTLWITLFAATWCVYVVLTVRSARANGWEAVMVLLVVAVPSIAFFTRSNLQGTSTLGALRGATLVPLMVLLVTGARPTRVFDRPGMKARAYRRMSREQREAVDREDRASFLAQLALIAGLIAGVLAYDLSGATFLG